MESRFQFVEYKDGDADLWEKINLESNFSNFITSIHWINFQKSLGKETIQYFVKEEGKEIGLIYIEINRRKFTQYGFLPYNPVIEWRDEQILNNFTSELKMFLEDLARSKKLNSIRLNPYLEERYLNAFSNKGYQKSLAPAQARVMSELDISLTLDELKANMHETRRYEVNKSLKSGLKIKRVEDEEGVKEFYNLMKETTYRKGFTNFSEEYFIQQFSQLHSLGLTEIFLTYFKDKLLSAALINIYKGVGYYTHGASLFDAELSKLKAPSFIQFEIIKFLKENNCTKYNLWGILPKNVANRGLEGVSKFKRSFGGYDINLMPAVEVYGSILKYIPNRLYDFYIYRKDRI